MVQSAWDASSCISLVGCFGLIVAEGPKAPLAVRPVMHPGKVLLETGTISNFEFGAIPELIWIPNEIRTVQVFAFCPPRVGHCRRLCVRNGRRARATVRFRQLRLFCRRGGC